MPTTATQPPTPGSAPSSAAREGRHGQLPQFDRPLDLSGRAVLLATDGSEPSTAAAHVARDLAAQHHAMVHVVSVVDTRGAPIPPPLDLALAVGDAVTGPELHAARNEEILAGLSTSLGERVTWPVRTTIGAPAAAIVHESRRLQAALVIVGLRRHHRMDRVLHDETALEVMRHAPCPVLGVASSLTRLPTRVLVAVDFSDTSRIAASVACGITMEGATIILAYVEPLTAYETDDGARAIHDLGVAAGFTRTIAELSAAKRSFDTVVLHHQVPRATADLLLEEADTRQAELIAAGSTRHGRLDRWIMGSVSTELVRDGRCSVLVVPPRDRL